MGRLTLVIAALTLSIFTFQNCGNDPAKLNGSSGGGTKAQGVAFGQYNVDNITSIKRTDSGMGGSSILTVTFLQDGTALIKLDESPRYLSTCTNSGTLDLSITNLLKESLIEAETRMNLPTDSVMADCGTSRFELAATDAAPYSINFDRGDCTPDQLVLQNGLLTNLLEHYRSQLSCSQ